MPEPIKSNVPSDRKEIGLWRLQRALAASTQHAQVRLLHDVVDFVRRSDTAHQPRSKHGLVWLQMLGKPSRFVEFLRGHGGDVLLLQARRAVKASHAIGSATGPLTLNTSNSYPTYTEMDGSNPSSPVLSGSPTFNGPISVLFSTPVAAVGLDGGYFNAIGGTSIAAFDASGGLLGSVTNAALGIEFFGLSTVSGASVISGISFYITGEEPAGFAIDNLTFGSAAEVVIPGDPGAVPEPSTYGLIGVGALLALVGYRRFKRA